MHLVDIYKFIYYLLVTVATKRQCDIYKYRLAGSTLPVKSAYLIILIIFLVLLIGLRPPGDFYFADSFWYNYNYRHLEGIPFTFKIDAPNVIWDNLFNYFCANRLGISNLFLLSDVIYFGCTYFALKKLFPNDYVAAYLVFLGAFSTFSFAYNGIKAGLAASIFLLALAYRKNLLLSVLLVLISLGFHHSMQLPVAAYIIARICSNAKVFMVVWVLCLLIAVLHISYFQNLFASMADEGGKGYLMGGDGGAGASSGFRLDFVLYSAVPIWIAYISLYKKRLSMSKDYLLALNIYLITNSVWMLCMYASYTNRIAYLSWFIYPVVLIYPILNKNWGEYHYKTFAKVVGYQLMFTLFMEYIYYGLIKY